MRINRIFLFIILLLLCCCFIAKSQSNDSNKRKCPLFIKFDFSKQIYLTNDFIEKRKENGKTVFTKGLETNGFVDYFFVVSRNYKSFSKINSKNLISAKKTNEKMFRNRKIILLEITEKKDTVLYEATWKRKYFKE